MYWFLLARTNISTENEILKIVKQIECDVVTDEHGMKLHLENMVSNGLSIHKMVSPPM